MSLKTNKVYDTIFCFQEIQSLIHDKAPLDMTLLQLLLMLVRRCTECWTPVPDERIRYMLNRR